MTLKEIEIILDEKLNPILKRLTEIEKRLERLERPTVSAEDIRKIRNHGDDNFRRTV